MLGRFPFPRKAARASVLWGFPAVPPSLPRALAGCGHGRFFSAGGDGAAASAAASVGCWARSGGGGPATSSEWGAGGPAGGPAGWFHWAWPVDA